MNILKSPQIILCFILLMIDLLLDILFRTNYFENFYEYLKKNVFSCEFIRILIFFFTHQKQFLRLQNVCIRD